MLCLSKRLTCRRHQRFATTQTQLALPKDSILIGLNIAALINTLMLLWLAFVQVGLLIHGGRFLTGKDLAVFHSLTARLDLRKNT